MHARRLRSLGCAVVATALSAAALAGCSSGGQHAASGGPAAPGSSVGQQLSKSLPEALLQTPLVTSTGRHLTVGSLAGKVVVISDMMTLCQETCPLDTAEVVAAARAVEKSGLGDRVVFLSITVDPKRDTASRLAAYRRQFAPAPADWLDVTGPAGSLAALWRDLGVYTERVPDTAPAPRDWLTGRPLTYDITHSDEVFFVDTGQHERFLLEGPPHLSAGSTLSATLRRFLDASGRRNLTHPHASSWTAAQELQVLGWLIGRPIGAGPGS